MAHAQRGRFQALVNTEEQKGHNTAMIETFVDFDIPSGMMRCPTCSLSLVSAPEPDFKATSYTVDCCEPCRDVGIASATLRASALHYYLGE